MSDLLIFGTCFAPNQAYADAVFPVWYECLARAEDLSRHRVVMIDAASPIEWQGLFPAETLVRRVETNQLFDMEDPGPGKVLVVTFKDNIGHVFHAQDVEPVTGLTSKDGAGRALCQGVRLARLWGLKYFVHVEADCFVFGKGLLTRRARTLLADLSAPQWLGSVESNLVMGRTDRLNDFEARYDWASVPLGTEMEEDLFLKFRERLEWWPIEGGRDLGAEPPVEIMTEGETDQYWTTNGPFASEVIRACNPKGLIDPKSVEHPVAMLVHGLGDMVLALPTLRALADIFEGRLSLICPTGISEALFGGLRFQSVYEEAFLFEGTEDYWCHCKFDSGRLERFCSGSDLFVSLNPWQSRELDEFIARLSPARTIGFASGLSRYDEPIHYDSQSHSCDRLFQFVRRFEPDYRIETVASPPVLQSPHVATADAILSEFPPGSLIVCVHGDTVGKKNLSPERLRAIIDGFLASHPDYLALIVGVEDLGLESCRCGDRVIPCLDIPLGLSMAMVARSDLFLGVDSCMLHVADLFRIPGVACFGPSSAAEYGYRWGRHVHLEGAASADDIQVGAAVSALTEMARGVRRPSPRHSSSGQLRDWRG